MPVALETFLWELFLPKNYTWVSSDTFQYVVANISVASLYHY